MIYKKINDMSVSGIVLGTDYYGSIVSEKDCMNLLDMYTDAGGTCVDTAKMYVDGTSEKIIGKWLKTKTRDKVIISTKGGNPVFPDMTKARLSEKDIEEDLNSSLRRLGTDYIDIYWLHRDDESVSVEPIMSALNKFIKQGKIRNIGASNWTAERIKEANLYAKKQNFVPFCASQIKWSLATTNPLNNYDPALVEMNKEEYEFYKKDKMPVFAYASLGKGFFSKMDKGGVDALSEKAKERYYWEGNVKRFEALKELSLEKSVSVSSAAISYIYSDVNTNSVAIIGPKNEKQLMENLKFSDFVLSEYEREFLER